jgi:hypothetical protein
VLTGCSPPARPPPPAASQAFLRGLREACDEADALLVFDEVQVGRRWCSARSMSAAVPEAAMPGLCCARRQGARLTFGIIGWRTSAIQRTIPPS